jgi:hypothetical protein
MDELKAIIERIHRRSEIMVMDAKTPTQSAGAEEIRQLARMALKKMENLEHEIITSADGSGGED